MEEFNFNILNLLSILVAAWFGGAAAQKVGYPAILGELIIGIILGPAILGWLEFTTTVKVLSEVGIIMLMVYIGIEIDFSDLKKASWAGLLAATGGFVVPFVMGYYAILWFGGDIMAGLFVGIAVGVTSLATKSRILVDLKLLNTRIAYVLMAGALISDTLALLIFAGILSFSEIGTFDMVGLGVVGLKALAFFAVTISIGLFVFPILGRFFSRSNFKSSTFYFTLILIVAFGYAEIAELAGMHSILGAFMAGLFIKENLFPKNVSKEVNKAFYDVSIGFLAPIFFVSAGFLVTINVFQTDLSMLLTVVGLAIVGKIVGTAVFYLPSGHGWREGITVGSGMNGRGAVEIIIAGIGLEAGIIDQNIFSILVFMAIFTTMTVPFLLTWTTQWLRRRGELVHMGNREGYLILGVNPISLYMAKILNEKSKVTFIDANQGLVSIANEKGFHCVHGNVLKEETLTEVNADTAETFISLTSNSEINILAAQFARESFQIPFNYVTMSKNEDGAGTDVLETIQATSLFAGRINIEDWNQKISSYDYLEKTEIIQKKIAIRSWLKHKLVDNLSILPIFIKNAEGNLRIVHYGEHLEVGDEILYLI